MSHKVLLILVMLAGSLLAASCAPVPASPTPGAGLPNPASVFCEQNGGKLELRQDAAGGVAGVCIFPDGSECDEWAYYRGECSPGAGGSAASPGAGLPNPASVFCEQNGGKLELRQDAAGGVAGVCIFPDGSECDEWAYYRGECAPGAAAETSAPGEFPTPLPIDPADYQGWWTYTSPADGFSLRLPADWVVQETTGADPMMNGHLLYLHPQSTAENLNLRVTFRRTGEEAPLWPTGVGAGEFVPAGTLDVAGEPAQRMLFVCPTGQVGAIWFQGGRDTPNIRRGDLEFGFIFGYTGVYCQEGYSLGGKVQRVGEMIVASLATP